MERRASATGLAENAQASRSIAVQTTSVLMTWIPIFSAPKCKNAAVSYSSSAKGGRQYGSAVRLGYDCEFLEAV
ncbi:MAG TPA: hypothetical protein ENJ18_04245 [Nannocystis exedens]|nr:hypothetical protein [Nannocystis exedens]